jgi:hypothetical protein
MAEADVLVRMSRAEALELVDELRDPPIPPHQGLQTGALMHALERALDDVGTRLDEALEAGEV